MPVWLLDMCIFDLLFHIFLKLNPLLGNSVLFLMFLYIMPYL